MRRFWPAVHAHIDGVPVSVSLGKSTPLAALLSQEQEGIEYLQVAQTHIAALNRQSISPGPVALCPLKQHPKQGCRSLVILLAGEESDHCHAVVARATVKAPWKSPSLELSHKAAFPHGAFTHNLTIGRVRMYSLCLLAITASQHMGHSGDVQISGRPEQI